LHRKITHGPEGAHCGLARPNRPENRPLPRIPVCSKTLLPLQPAIREQRRHNGLVKREPEPVAGTGAVRVQHTDRPEALSAIIDAVAQQGGRLRMLSTVRRLDGDPALVEVELEVEGLDAASLTAALEAVPGVREVQPTRSLERVFGKRIIVIGGGAQVTQVALGAVSEADRHNLRGERISVDTIPLVGEAALAAAVRGVADLPRARCLVLAGSLMGGEITRAVRELRERGIPVIALNMAGSVPEAADLVVSDPVQAGTMAVMAVADTGQFSLERQRGRRY
jgi:energy-converting hydrogenase B subunit Q